MIRQARHEDTKALAPLLYLAMGEIAHGLAGESSYEKTLAVLARYMGMSACRLSTENIWVYEEGGEVAGAMVLYAGAEACALDVPILHFLGREVPFEQECPPNGWYLDAIATAEAFRGRGIAKGLIEEGKVLGRARGHDKFWLVADAKQLALAAFYSALGFSVYEERSLLEHPYLLMGCDL
ncbi:GNAT family N-acetyltransferase [Sulfurospirillum sp. T05]|uniref:GNAT family N-acetyltransferase n=1 Tax=Sulfurospirillum tamanense TaxID=2813362 RepID=A0ABS2WTQ5_9BACT|nr:GNAT family N-acetyltransferase [Sulfurospirillum tamanensis]MBN2965017.1 GNAT family N-acetyltransferase [Sulfurospirillum tamanensis]